MKKLVQAALLLIALLTTSTQVLANHNEADNDLIPLAEYTTDVDAEYDYEPAPRPERPTPPAPLRENATEEEIIVYEQAMLAFQEAEDAYYAAFTPEEILITVPMTERGLELLRDTLAAMLPEIPTLDEVNWNPHIFNRLGFELGNLFNESGRLSGNFHTVNSETYWVVRNEMFFKAHDTYLHILENYMNTFDLTYATEFYLRRRDMYSELLFNNTWILMYYRTAYEFGVHIRAVSALQSQVAQLRVLATQEQEIRNQQQVQLNHRDIFMNMWARYCNNTRRYLLGLPAPNTMRVMLGQFWLDILEQERDYLLILLSNYTVGKIQFR